MLKIVWSYSHNPLSVIIKWLTGEPVSHVAVIFMNHIVMHSNLLGVHITGIGSFNKKSKILYEHEIPMSDQRLKPIMFEMINSYDGMSYDWKVFFYMGLRLLLYRLFGVSMPKKSSINSKNGILCTEIARLLPIPELQNKLNGMDIQIMTPYMLYKVIKGDSNASNLW